MFLAQAASTELLFFRGFAVIATNGRTMDSKTQCVADKLIERSWANQHTRLSLVFRIFYPQSPPSQESRSNSAPPKPPQSIEPIEFLAQFHVKLNNMRQNIKK